MGADRMAPAEPRLTFVVTARNDDYGGGFLRRVQTFVNALSAQTERHRLASELVLVDWNSPEPIADEIEWPESTGWMAGRVIRVPPAIHEAMPYADELTFREMPAKNVGVRRARAPFVLTTNVDDVFSDQLFESLNDELRPGHFYRADRHDTLAEPDTTASLAELLAACEESVVLRHESVAEVPVDGERDTRPRSTLSGLLTTRPLVRIGRAAREAPGTIARHGSDPRRLVRIVRERWDRELGLHTDASGDFLLLAKADWERMEGYPELPGHHVHVDGIFLYECHNAGLRQVHLPGPLYHIEHGRLRPPTGEMTESNAGAAPWISAQDLYKLTLEAARSGRRVLPHTPQWGLAGRDLAERRVI